MTSTDVSALFDEASGADSARAWCALARVVDDDPVQVLERGGKVLGLGVECTIVDGPFVGSTVVAKIAAPIGSPIPELPEPGDTILLQLPHGHLDGPVLATHVVPGGEERPMPAASAGVAMTPEGLAATSVTAPPKGKGVRFYIRGAPFVIRLKGAQEGYAGELYIEADDGGADKNGTYIRLTRNPTNGKFGIKLRDVEGAFVQVHDGKISLQSPNGENGIYVTDEGVKIYGARLDAKFDDAVLIDGAYVGLCMGTLPPNPLNSVAVGTAGPVNILSPRVYAGIV